MFHRIPTNRQLTQTLADEFSRSLRDHLIPIQQLEPPPSDEANLFGRRVVFNAIDANAFLRTTFRQLIGREYDLTDSWDTSIVTSAWEQSKRAGFARRLTLAQNARGEPVYAFTIRDKSVHTPGRSPHDTASVYPAPAYGLTQDEVSALEDANARLRSQRAATEPSEVIGSREPAEGSKTAHTMRSIQATYPNLQTWQTGGGCLAYAHLCDDGGHLLITDSGGLNLPEAGDTEVLVGRYAKNGDVVEPATMVSVAELETWIDAALARARSPECVADYFSAKLGEGANDGTLRTLPIDSDCGQDCIEAIDAALGLIIHIRMAMGNDGEVEDASKEVRRTPEPDVIDVVRKVVSIYWRG